MERRSLKKNHLAPNVWLHSSVGRATHRQRGGHGFESRWSPDFFQASFFQLLKLENLLRWSFFIFIYNRSSKMNYFIYTSLILLLQAFPSSTRSIFKKVKVLLVITKQSCFQISVCIFFVCVTTARLGIRLGGSEFNSTFFSPTLP